MGSDLPFRPNRVVGRWAGAVTSAEPDALA